MARRGHLLVGLLVLACAAASAAGSLLAVRATSPTVRSSALGTIAFSAVPTRNPRLDVYVPIVDWGVRARPYDVPVAVELEVRSLDRETAAAALRSDRPAHANLPLLREELAAVIVDGLLRAGAAAVVGGAIGGFLGGALLVAFGRRRRWLVAGAGVGLATSIACVSLLAAALTHADRHAFDELTFYAHGDELPRLLALSEELLEAGESYADAYDRALAGVATLIAAAGDRDASRPPTRTMLVASDLHSNRFVLAGLADYAAGKPVFLAGDLTQLGAPYEDELLRDLVSVGQPVVAVSGNHDSRRFMRVAARAGLIVLTREGRLRADGSLERHAVVGVDGLRIAGYDDPLERGEGGLAARTDLRDESFADAQAEFVAWFEALDERPDVVIVHRHAFAHALFDVLAERGGSPVLVLTGHDHEQHIHEREGHVLVDGGTVGAGGAFGIGEERAGFIQLHLDAENGLQAADLIEVDPLSGAASARRVVFERETEAAAKASGS